MVKEDGKFGEIKSSDQTYNDKRNTDIPISYITDELGLNLNIFKWIETDTNSIKELKDGLTIDVINSKFPWLLKFSVFKDAVLGINKKTNQIIWYDGTWYDGIWKDGIWKSGTWESGNWQNGSWEDKDNPHPDDR